MNDPKEPGLQDDLYLIAADWHNRLEEPNAGPIERAQLDVWLRKDPRHAAAYEAIERMWAGTARLATEPAILAFRHEALAAVSPAPVVGSRRGFFSSVRGRGPAVRLFAAAALVVIAIGGALVSLTLSHNQGATGNQGLTDRPALAGQRLDAGTFTTAVGERSTIALSDGSSIVLDTKSRVEVAYSRDQRRIRLVGGQAWFQVAHNPDRPFVVEAGDRRITALGTAFDVRIGSSQKSIQVTLVEGKVTVEAIQSPLARLIRPAPSALVLTPGDSLLVSDIEPVHLERADVAKIASWRQGQLIFDNDTLGSAVQEVNRYSNTQIVLADPALAKLRVSGVFNAGHSQSFIETIIGHYPISAVERSDGRVVLTPKPSAAFP